MNKKSKRYGADQQEETNTAAGRSGYIFWVDKTDLTQIFINNEKG